jgi:hypothetical protein
VRFVSNAAAVVVAAIAIATTVPDIALPWHPFSSFGFFVNGGNRVVAILPGSSAEARGVKTADEIDFPSTEPANYRYVTSEWGLARPGTRAIFGFRRDGGVRRIELVAQPVARTPAENASLVALVIAVEVAIAVALILVLMRPSALTWSFFVYACCSGVGSLLVLEYADDRGFWIVSNADAVAWALRAPALLSFALLFPAPQASGWRLQVLRYVVPPLTLVLLAGSLVPAWYDWGLWIYDAAPWIQSLCLFAAVAVFAVTYASASGTDRARMSWVMLSALIAFGGKWLVDLLWELGYSASDWVTLTNAGYSLQLLFALAVAYAVAKHRVIDVRFFLSRTLVFSGLTLFLVVGLRAIDWLLTVAIAGERFAVIVEFAAAVGMGLALHAIQRRLEHAVGRILFRSRYDAEKRLRRLCAGLVHAESLEPVCTMLVEEPAAALNLASCALFLRDEAGWFVRRGSSGWESCGLMRVSPDDPAILELKGSFEPLWLGDVHDDLFDRFDTERKPALALAVHTRGRLRGVLFVGAHASGEALDPAEVRLLRDVAASAGHAFDHVEAAALQRRVDELEEALRRASPQPNA